MEESSLIVDQINDIIKNVTIPGAMRSLNKMNMVRSINVSDHSVNIDISSTVLLANTKENVEAKINGALKDIDGVNTVNINYTENKPGEINKIHNIIAIMSGKGGVGKSLVSSLTAIALRRQGYEVGILDADITGPSIPKMFGIKDRPVNDSNGILPALSESGIEVMSINLLLPGEDEAVIWRGPLIGKMITQFWQDVYWGELDYLIVDLPPGTADAPLTVLQQLPVSGIIIVFTPQDLTAMIVRKAVNMAKQMNKRIIGVVENMSYLYVPEINKKIELFGKSNGEEMAKDAGAPLLAQLPIDPELAKLCDKGKIESYNSEIIDKMGKSLTDILREDKVQEKD
jgi:Mrp family chromosome partitioning ATPase